MRMSDAGKEDKNITGYDLKLLCLLTVLNVLNMVDRNLLTSFSAYIVPDLGLSNTEFGLLTGLVFLFFYSIMGLFMGALADTMNRVHLITFGVALWSALTAVSGAAKGFVSMAIPRMFIGVGESIMTPSAMSLLADRFPADRLGFAAGFYYLGAPIGAGASFLIAGYLGPMIGWRNCFYLLGAIGLLLAIVFLFVREPERRHLNENQESRQSIRIKHVLKTALSAIPKSRALMLTMAGGTIMHVAVGGAFFEQLWFVEERGYERAEIAKMTGWLMMTAGVLGAMLGGIGGDWITAKTGLGRPIILAGLILLAAPFLLALRLSPGGSMWIPVGLFFGLLQFCAFPGPTFATVQELVPPQVRSTIVAATILMFNIVGLGIGITFTGIAIDAMVAAEWNQPYSVAMIGSTVIGFLAIPIYFFAGIFYKDEMAAGVDQK